MNNMNMDELVKLCGIGLLAAFSAVILRELKKEYAAAILLGMTTVVLFAVIPNFADAVGFLRELQSEANTEYVSVILRGVGVTYLTGTACEICRSAGEAGIAGTIELVGRAELLLMCIPLFRELVGMALLA